MDQNRFNKRIKLTQEILAKIGKIDEFKGLWQGSLRISPQILGRLKLWVIITSTGASTRIEGAKMTDEELNALTQNQEIIRNRLKINSARKNAVAFINIQNEFGSFNNYIWAFVDNKPIIGNWSEAHLLPNKTAISDKISKDLKKRGMSFVGSVIIYSYMQAIGLVDDHTTFCWKFKR